MPSEKRARQRAGRAARVAELQRAQQRRRRNRRVIPAIVVIVIIAIVGIFLTSSGGSKKKNNVATASSTSSTAATSSTTAATTSPTAAPVTAGTITGSTPCPKLDGSSPHIIHFAKAPPNCLQAGKTYTGTIVTNMGNVVVKFDTTKTPVTANNFIVLSLYHYFDGTSIFRTDTSIGIIQGGSPHTQDNSDPGPGYTIPDEGSGYTYAPGDLVMARTSAPNSASAQFFFCVTNACSNLNSQGTYVVFATTTSGLNVLQKILSLNSGNGQLGGAPSQLVTIKSITITAT